MKKVFGHKACFRVEKGKLLSGGDKEKLQEQLALI